MRFGIMAMQMAALLPPEVASSGAGTSSSAAAQLQEYVAAFDHAGLVEMLHQAGFGAIELGGDLGMFIPTAYQPPAIAALAALKVREDLTYTVHLPLWSVEPSTPLRPVREGSVQAILDVIEATYPLAPEVYVLHATGALAAEFSTMRLPGQSRALILRQFQAAAMESLHTLLTTTGLPSRQLAIETIEFPFDLTLEMAQAFDLSICLDVGHVLSGFSGPLSLDEVLDASAPRLAEVHLHDAPLPPPTGVVYGRDHQALGQGDLDVAGFLDRLNDLGFAGPVIFELTVPEAQASLELVRELRPKLLS